MGDIAGADEWHGDGVNIMIGRKTAAPVNTHGGGLQPRQPVEERQVAARSVPDRRVGVTGQRPRASVCCPAHTVVGAD